MAVFRVQPARVAETTAKRIWTWVVVTVLAILALKLAFDLLVIPAFKQQLSELWRIGQVDNYHTLAKNIARGYGYRFLPDTSPTLLREPGYPLFLSELVDVFDDYFRAAVVANLLISCATAVLIAYLARCISPLPAVPLIAAIAYLLHPGVLLAELRSGVEIPFTLFLVGFFIALRNALRTRRVADYALAGIALGLASYIRSTALLFPAFLLIYTAITDRAWRPWMQSAFRIGVLFTATLLVLSPWIIRNYMLVGQFVPTASVQGTSMQVGTYVCMHAAEGKTLHELDVAAAAERVAIARSEGYRFVGSYYQFFYNPHDEMAFNSSLEHAAIRHYIQAPAAFARCTAENLLNFWFRGKNRAATLTNICIQVPYLLLAVFGFIRAREQADRELLAALALFVLYTMAVYAPILAHTRYSVPLVPLIAIFAAVPIAGWITRAHARYVSKRCPPALRGGAG